MFSSRNTQAGITGGTLLSLLPIISSEELAKALILAALGTAVSFGVSLILQWLIKPKGKSHRT
ncbi:MAG: hypothetical protein EPN39_05900 [Chitinophagaceae bacterium]|jgi:hypothetical protein|nr:MAG: hypothetical protein EPN39_05900 [Chitinophagaceae bacterium]